MPDGRTLLAGVGVGAGVVALCAAAWWVGHAGSSAVDRAELAAAEKRIADLERQVAEDSAPRADHSERTRPRMASLEERVRAIELGIETRGRDRVQRPPAAAPEDGGPAATEVDQAAESQKAEVRRKQLERLNALRTEAVSLGRSVAGIRLRLLPEAERWEQAAEKLGLSGVQVDLLKQAVSDRNAAYVDATNQSIEKTDTGLTSVTEVDGRALEQADSSFRRALEGALDPTQQKTWTENGFDGAFGKSRPANRRLTTPAKSHDAE